MRFRLTHWFRAPALDAPSDVMLSLGRLAIERLADGVTDCELDPVVIGFDTAGNRASELAVDTRDIRASVVGCKTLWPPGHSRILVVGAIK
jgi:hypothetical protein